MTSPYLLADLKADEGCELRAYPDPLTGGEPWTVGYGCTGPGIGPSTVWTQTRAEDELVRRVASIKSDLMTRLPWFLGLSPLRQDVLINMAFNLGVAGLLTFKTTLSHMQHAEWSEAADGMLASLWARQVKGRAHRLAKQMKTDTHA